MSWDAISREQHKCPCGQNTYTVVSLMDDWGRSGERWEMDCPDCKLNYRLFQYWISRNKPGEDFEAHLWVPIATFLEMERGKARLENAKGEVVEVATSRYMERWLRSFEDAKTKKEVWRRLTEEREMYPSLSTFRAHIKIKGQEKYLREWFDYHTIPDILRKLGLSDSEIDRRIQEIGQFEAELEASKNHLKQLGFV